MKLSVITLGEAVNLAQLRRQAPPHAFRTLIEPNINNEIRPFTDKRKILHVSNFMMQRKLNLKLVGESLDKLNFIF